MPRSIRQLGLSATVLATLAATAFLPGSARAEVSGAHASTFSSGEQGAAEWSQRGFDATHRSFNALETVLGPANVSQLTVKWQQLSAALIAKPMSSRDAG